MLRSSEMLEPIRTRHKEADQRRRSTPLMPTNFNSLNSPPPMPTVLSPPPTPRSPPIRPDRLSLRLRSNSGLKLHMNEVALSQYTDYDANGQCIDYKNGGMYSASSALITPGLDEAISPLNASAGFRRSNTWTTSGLTSCLPFLDFLGKDAFQMALENPSVTRHLTKYCEDQGCEENVEFLVKIREFSQATNEMTSVLAAISTTYTSIGATQPLNLPPMLSRPLNTDIKRFAHSILPGLETVFLETKIYVENRLATEVFPGFVKNQLAHCTTVALSSGIAGGSCSQLEYPGLGESFCITDALKVDNYIVGASDAFSSLTGYDMAEVMKKKCGFLQGPFTDPDAVRRIQVAVRDRREAVELILNHRKDGEPFWNLLFLFPLKDSQGRLQNWLGAQVNVSECMSSRKDLLRILNGGVSPDPGCEGSMGQSDDRSEKESTKDSRTINRENGVHSRQSSRSTSSRNRLFQNFLSSGKQPMASPPSPTPPTIPESSHTLSMKQGRSSRFSSQRYQPRAQVQVQVFPTAYSYYIILRCLYPDQAPFYTVANAKQSSAPTPTRKKTSTRSSMRLSVAYYSDAAVDLLSIRADISQADIFHVLAEKANSPSVTKSFKGMVRERIEAGKSVKLELLLDRSKSLLGKRRNSSAGTAASKDTSEGVGGGGSSSNADGGKDRDGKLSKAVKTERLMSHWTPLKDETGNVDWVVLILTSS